MGPRLHLHRASRLRGGDEGILVAHGDQGGGYLLSVEDGRLTFAHNDGHRMRRLDGGTLAPGSGRIVLEATAPGGNVWNFTLRVDGEERAAGEGFPLFLAMAPFEGIDVGIDRRSPVDWSIHERHGPFPWTGSLDRVTYEPGTHAARRAHADDRAARGDGRRIRVTPAHSLLSTT